MTSLRGWVLVEGRKGVERGDPTSSRQPCAVTYTSRSAAASSTSFPLSHHIVTLFNKLDELEIMQANIGAKG